MTRSVAKKGRRGRRPSLYRDAHFHVSHEEFRECTGSPQAAPPSVYRGEDSLDPFSHSSPSSFPVSVIPLESTSARARTPAEVQERVRLFWRPWNIPPDLFPRHHVTPAPWQDLSVPATITYFHRAITSFGNSRTFSLNLSHAIEAKARAEAVPIDWLEDSRGPTVHGLRGSGILLRYATGYGVNQIANDIGMSRPMVEHYMRFKDQMEVAVEGRARLKVV
jgi:hypothetical protein